MRKHCILIAFALTALGCFAQPKASTPQKIVSADNGLMCPVWSPDGKLFAFTSDNFFGLWVANADGKNVVRLSDENGVGYKYLWDTTGESLIVRTSKLVEGRVFHELKTINVASLSTNTIVPLQRNLSTPSLCNDGMIATSRSQVVNTKGVKEERQLDAYSIMVAAPFDATSMLAEFADYSDKPIINPALSPDGKQIAFQIAGKGLFVCNADGTKLKNIGRGSYPVWTADSRYVIAAQVKDNGEVITSSELVAISPETTASKVVLSIEGMIPLTTSVSPDGSRLLFENAADGCIYITNLK